MPIEISIPFHVGEDGKVDTLSDPDAQIRQHVMSLINTAPTERVMIPTYGVDTYSQVFAPEDLDVVSIFLGNMIREAFDTWERGVQLTSVVPKPDDSNDIAEVDVEYQRRDSVNTTGMANSNTAIIGSDGTVKEIVRG